MAHGLGLFDPTIKSRDNDVFKSRDFTAWGLFYLQRYDITTSQSEIFALVHLLITTSVLASDAITL